MFSRTASQPWGQIAVVLAIASGCSIDTFVELDSSTVTLGPDGCVPSLEVCDGIDNDCDPSTPDGAEQEGLGLPCDSERDPDRCQTGTLVCREGRAFCDEEGPGEVEFCNNRDDDCDEAVDEDVATMLFFRDSDGDGFGATEVMDCAPRDGYVTVGGDCNDGNTAVYPGAPEICDDGIDQSCTGTPDDAATCTCQRFESSSASYWVCREALRWDDARDACQTRGAILAAPVESNIAFVHDIVRTVDPGRQYWTGLNLNSDSSWRWANGDGASPVWHPGEPNSDFCVDLEAPVLCGDINQYGTPTLNDACCDLQRYYVCEF